MYLSKSKKKKFKVLHRGDRRYGEKRTPEQTDHADEHKSKVCGDDGEVDGLGGYVYGPRMRKKNERGGGGDPCKRTLATTTHQLRNSVGTYAFSVERTGAALSE